jgi:hypothetical protein
VTVRTQTCGSLLTLGLGPGDQEPHVTHAAMGRKRTFRAARPGWIAS